MNARREKKIQVIKETLRGVPRICEILVHEKKKVAYLVPAGLKAIEKAAVISSIASYARYVQRNCKFHWKQRSETIMAVQKPQCVSKAANNINTQE